MYSYSQRISRIILQVYVCELSFKSMYPGCVWGGWRGEGGCDEAEDKKRIIKSLIERIPTAKEELFAYSLDWSIVDQVGVCCSGYVLFQVEIVALLAPLGRHSSGTCKRIIACSD